MQFAMVRPTGEHLIPEFATTQTAVLSTGGNVWQRSTAQSAKRRDHRRSRATAPVTSFVDSMKIASSRWRESGDRFWGIIMEFPHEDIPDQFQQEGQQHQAKRPDTGGDFPFHQAW